MHCMEKVFQKFTSHADAERANRAYYRQLSPTERLDILLELVARYREDYCEKHGEASEGFERVYRIVQRKRR